jgi:hypothetical protein
MVIKNVQKGAGPVYVYRKSGSNKNLIKNKTQLKKERTLYGDNIDNVVGYSYEIDPNNGNHIPYVDSDYVE